MICPHCEHDTPPDEALCVHCGGALDVTFDELSEVIYVDALIDREQERVRRARRGLVFSIALLALVLITHALLVPPLTRHVPLAPLDPAAIVPGGARIDAIETERLALPELDPVVPRGRRR